MGVIPPWAFGKAVDETCLHLEIGSFGLTLAGPLEAILFEMGVLGSFHFDTWRCFLSVSCIPTK